MRAPMAITAWVMEGTMDAIARQCRLDPLELRRRNSLTPQDLPWITATGEHYAALSPRATLDAAAAALGYENLRAQPPRPGMLRGIGLCSVVESTTYGSAFYKAAGIAGSGHEVASLRIEPSGAIIAACGLMGSGQGYETTLAQAVASGLGVEAGQVTMQLGHTDIAPYGMGSRGSRGAAAGGGVLRLAGLALRRKLLELAAHLLNLNSADGLEMRAGLVIRRVAEGELETGLSLAALARIAHLDPLRLPPGMAPGLHHIEAFDPPAMTYSNSTHACVVEIDPETGALTILRHVIAEDAGTLINPMIVEGQLHGGITQGIGQALLEHCVYDPATGQMLSGSFQDYCMPRADNLPSFDMQTQPVPSTDTPMGVKGCGEVGSIGAPAAIINAVVDALGPYKIRHLDMPATPARIWRAIADNTMPMAAE